MNTQMPYTPSPSRPQMPQKPPYRRRSPNAEKFLILLVVLMAITAIVGTAIAAKYYRDHSEVTATDVPTTYPNDDTTDRKTDTTADDTTSMGTDTTGIDTTDTNTDTTSDTTLDTTERNTTSDTTKDTVTDTTTDTTDTKDTTPESDFTERIDVRLLTNSEARSKIYMAPADVNYIVVHYTANPGSTAINNRNYFNNPSANTAGSSSHFIVGLNGEIIQCIPTNEVAWANYPMNYETISIEVCHPDKTGKYNDVTYDSLIDLLVWLCEKFGFDETNVIRHYDVHRLSGKTHEQSKKCPLYYVENEDAWQQLLDDVAAGLAD